MLGVLGGMGPLATADFLEKFVRLNPAEKDQDHPPVVVFSNPKIPDRIGPILHGITESPLPALVDSAQRLQQFGATMLVMPCHTAHFWHGEISRTLDIPFLHIADATCDELQGCSDTVGLLATEATLKTRIYQSRFDTVGISFIEPEWPLMERHVLPAIAAVKQDRVRDAAALLAPAVDHLLGNGAGRLILACTELPVILQHMDESVADCCLDPTLALARACAEWAKDN